MNKYNSYAFPDARNGITECVEVTPILDDLSNQPCNLSVARGKPAVLRVGGGENWGDVYGAVKAFNEAQPKYLYHIVGGAATTVSPMGWSFLAGLGGTAVGRMFGFGADNILQIEAVLPNGWHVRFGPTSWEAQEGYLFPCEYFRTPYFVCLVS